MIVSIASLHYNYDESRSVSQPLLDAYPVCNLYFANIVS